MANKNERIVLDTIDEKELEPINLSSPEQEKLDIFAFLPENTQKAFDEIVTVPAPPGYNNPDGSRAIIQIRKIPFEMVSEMMEKYKTRRVFKQKGRPVIQSGRVSIIEERDDEAFSCALIVEALVFPNLKAQDLLEKYQAAGMTLFQSQQLVAAVFPTAAARNYVLEKVTEVNGLTTDAMEDDEILEKAKN